VYALRRNQIHRCHKFTQQTTYSISYLSRVLLTYVYHLLTVNPFLCNPNTYTYIINQQGNTGSTTDVEHR